MFCKKCGNKLDDNAKFCTKCGTPVDEEKKEEKNVNDDSKSPKENGSNNKNNDNKSNTSFGKRIFKIVGKLIMVFVVLLIIAIVVMMVLDHFGIISADSFKNKKNYDVELKGEVLDDDSYRVEAPDAEEYYENNSQIISVKDVADSEAILTGNAAKDVFAERGFEESTLITDYSIAGEYIGETEIEDDSSEKYPIYQSYYMAESGEMWGIYCIEGVLMANPVTYNMQSDRGVQLIISESDTVFSYDAEKNKIYETIPNDSELIVKKVDKITNELLDSLTYEAIDEL